MIGLGPSFAAAESEPIAPTPVQELNHLLSQATTTAQWLEQRQQFEWRGAPYGLTGMPVTVMNAQRRWTYGGRLHLANYSVRPYHFRVVSEWVRSSGGDGRLVVRAALPDIGRGFGLHALLDLGRAEGRFHGWGNTSSHNQSYTDPDSPEYIDSDYYSYFVERRRVLLMLSKPLWHSLGLDVGGGVEDADTKVHSDQSLLGALTGGADTERFTITDRRYLRLRQRLVFAVRNLFEVLDGIVPMDLYGEVGSSFDRVDGLGGNNSLRGFTLHRFMDDVRFLSNSELRYMLHSMRLLGQLVEINGVGFVDFGRVWEDLDSFSLSDPHGSVGGGLRFVWNRDFTMRVEAAHSGEQNSALATMDRNF